MECQEERGIPKGDPPTTMHEPNSSTKALFLEKVRQSNAACQSGDFSLAIRLYSEAIELDPNNYILYSNRSAAYVKTGQFDLALQDAVKARDLNPKWAKAYFRQGVALQCKGQHAEALAAFASGLAQDPKSLQLRAGMVEAAMKSPIREKLEPTYRQLQKMKLDKSPFVIISVIGQELLAAGFNSASLVVLECALKVGTCSLKLKGSVFSALSTAHWLLGNTEKAIAYMQQDLTVAKSLGDPQGECRVQGNLGSAYYSKGCYKESLAHHRMQLVLAMKEKDREVAAKALSSLGHVYTSVGDFPNALASHKQCVVLAKQINDKLFEARETGNMGTVYLAMGDFDNGIECHKQHLEIAKQCVNKEEEARAYSNLGSSYHYKRNFDQAMTHHNRVLEIAAEIEEKSFEARAYAGLGHAARCMGDHDRAKHCHEQQLNIALSTKDKQAEGRACSNLGIIYQLQGEFDTALKLHKAHLAIATECNDRAGQGRAFGNMGNAYSALGHQEQGVKYHLQELTIAKAVNDRASEASTHGNLAVAYQALNAEDKALQHYHSHLNISQEIKDKASEARALSNLGNYHSTRGEFSQAVPYYDKYLNITQEIQDIEGEGKACHNLGYAHYKLGNYKEAVHYYDMDLALAKDMQDKVAMAKAYCNLGLAHKALGNVENALECQKYFLSIAHVLKNVQGKFRALGNIGDALMAKQDTEGAVKFYEQQLVLAKEARNKSLEASAYAAMGAAHRLLRKFDKALNFHTQELNLCQEIGDVKGECKAHGHLGAVHTSLGKYTTALGCYEEQLARAKDLKDSAIEAQAYGNLGITKMNMGLFEAAIGYFEEQLATLEQVNGHSAILDRGRAYGNLGDCYEALGDYEDAVKHHEQHLTVALNSNSLFDQDRAYRGLGNAHRSMGNLQQALVCFEKRLVVAHELNNAKAMGSAYGELGCLHSTLGNFEQAISCLEHQLEMAKQMGNKNLQADAACGLGGVYQQMGEFEKALEFHQLDLEIAEENDNPACQGRAYGNLGVTHESLGNFQKAIFFQEQHLSIAAQMNDQVAKCLAYGSLGRTHHALGNYSQAITYLQQGLGIAEQLGRREDEARIRYRLGLALWSHQELEESQHQLYKAAAQFETIRRDSLLSSDYKLNMFDMQTACYQALQRVLVSLGRQEEALAIAERGRTRAFIDLLMERQGSEAGSVMDTSPVTVEQIVAAVDRQKAAVLYYSIAVGYLYSWLIMPNKGVVKFHECNMNELNSHLPSERESPLSGLSEKDNVSVAMSTSVLDQYVSHVREALGVETSIPRSSSETESEAEEMSMHSNSTFLRLINRNHVFNKSTTSMNSLLSQFSGLSAGSIRTASIGTGGGRRRRPWSGKPPLRALYDLLISPMEDVLPRMNGPKSPAGQLVLVLDGDLYLVPFAVLKGSSSNECLYERYGLVVTPSIQALSMNQQGHPQSRPSDVLPGLVLGNPKLPPSVLERWSYDPLPAAEQESRIISEMLGVKPLLGPMATKESVMEIISSAECVHFSTHVNWRLSAIVLSPGEPRSPPGYRGNSNNAVHNSPEQVDLNHDLHNDSDLESTTDTPSLSDFLLTAADILNLKLCAKLVVISCHHQESHSRITADGVVGLTRAFLAAGAQCALVSLWPVPDLACCLFMKAFYGGLMQGLMASEAMCEAMRVVQNTKPFSHPSNWAGFMLVGCDVKLSSKAALMGQALGELLQTPDRTRNAMRVLLHLVEKSLQRIHHGPHNSMYTTQQSIENKVGPVRGWKNLLISVGFHFESAANGLPPSVFFPLADPGERLTQCSTSLQALLGLPPNSLAALSKLVSAPEAGEALIKLLQSVLSQLTTKDSVQVPINVRLWRVGGCHELLASIGFDLIEVGKDEVTMRTGKHANKRNLQFALSALLAIFDTSEAPKSLTLGSSSSLESLSSSQSSTSVPAVPKRAEGLSPTPQGEAGDQRRLSWASLYSVSSYGIPDMHGDRTPSQANSSETPSRLPQWPPATVRPQEYDLKSSLLDTDVARASPEAALSNRLQNGGHSPQLEETPKSTTAHLRHLPSDMTSTPLAKSRLEAERDSPVNKLSPQTSVDTTVNNQRVSGNKDLSETEGKDSPVTSVTKDVNPPTPPRRRSRLHGRKSLFEMGPTQGYFPEVGPGFPRRDSDSLSINSSQTNDDGDNKQSWNLRASGSSKHSNASTASTSTLVEDSRAGGDVQISPAPSPTRSPVEEKPTPQQGEGNISLAEKVLQDVETYRLAVEKMQRISKFETQQKLLAQQMMGRREAVLNQKRPSNQKPTPPPRKSSTLSDTSPPHIPPKPDIPPKPTPLRTPSPYYDNISRSSRPSDLSDSNVSSSGEDGSSTPTRLKMKYPSSPYSCHIVDRSPRRTPEITAKSVDVDKNSTKSSKHSSKSHRSDGGKHERRSHRSKEDRKAPSAETSSKPPVESVVSSATPAYIKPRPPATNSLPNQSPAFAKLRQYFSSPPDKMKPPDKSKPQAIEMDNMASSPASKPARPDSPTNSIRSRGSQHSNGPMNVSASRVKPLPPYPGPPRMGIGPPPYPGSPRSSLSSNPPSTSSSPRSSIAPPPYSHNAVPTTPVHPNSPHNKAVPNTNPSRPTPTGSTSGPRRPSQQSVEDKIREETMLAAAQVDMLIAEEQRRSSMANGTLPSSANSPKKVPGSPGSKIVKIPPSKPNGPLRMVYLENGTRIIPNEKLLQSSKC
ncbi:Tetratricopeptide repeat protein 28 [Branchiostoma belcheri]|nr:Tetratricopeptide repeat protein 28 [Branchiostoma belcheri]